MAGRWPAQTPSPGQGRRRTAGRLSIWARRAMTLLEVPTPVVKRRCVGGGLPGATGGGSAPSSPPSWPCSSSGRLGDGLVGPWLRDGWMSASFHAEGKRPASQEELIRARSAASPARPSVGQHE
ncbi:hypothetical protein GWK47_039337 [Chionoecetes opilio]|uniref:Uncharacterized protein n=1 Tax=Chionoecetes opilio TaxID=41210 RepID=A0A8J5CXT5_CHIOP|nr:hypothetical protein GWK47_039337 [Chionoecetes opilio]